MIIYLLKNYYRCVESLGLVVVLIARNLYKHPVRCDVLVCLGCLRPTTC